MFSRRHIRARALKEVRAGVLLSALVAALACPARSGASTLLVYNNHDSGAGSLRQAILDNKNLGGGNTILFSNVVTGTITLTTGELLISNNVTILGPGPNVLAVSGNAASRVFNISNVVAVISGLTVTNGHVTGANYGGGIHSHFSDLTLSNCTVSGNSSDGFGGAIHNDLQYAISGWLTIIGSTISNNSASSGGGAIYNSGGSGGPRTGLSLIASTISGNSAAGGGGILNDALMLTVTNCTISGNSTTSGRGGGIYNGIISDTAGFDEAALTVIGSTFSGNMGTVAGGIYNEQFDTRTVSLTIGDTILKAGAMGSNIVNFGGSVTSLGHNLSSDNSGSALLTALGDQNNTDPMLGPLQNNGGPTLTHAPMPGSPAIDQGKNLASALTDQRGRCRTYDDPSTPNAAGGDGSDIGAVEASPAHGLVGTTGDSNGASLRWCLCDAQPGDTITFAPGVTGTVTLINGQLAISNSITILGPGANALAVNGDFPAKTNRVFYISGGGPVTISGLTITNGSTGSGGGIYNDRSTLTLSNCAVSGNSAPLGGGIYNDGFNGSGKLAVIASTISGNSAPAGFGAGIDNVGTSGSATLTVTNSTLCNNSAGADGGAIFSTGQSGGSATLAVIGSTISSNSASTAGGGIYNASGSTLTLGNTILKTGAAGANLVNGSGTIISLGYNISSDNGGGFLTNPTDRTLTDPLLGPLQNNGGPAPTMALLSGSPAIDKGKSFGLTTDQRGAPRPFDFASLANAAGGDGSDVGAFELGSPGLSIARQPPKAVISWPGYYGDFQLESVATLAASNNWSNVTNPVSNSGTTYSVTVPADTGNEFYRLQK
ncbi:MAG TPA: choice-of-anchor Q domain-containing protein [Candidatus Acidoferrum sp.]|nr:choice-of-anchor Q domain-containing protein [Candidatus Acidoferrum sp.]